MSLYRKKLGRRGEDEVCRRLKKQGFRLLAQNYTIRGGEIDLIMTKDEKIIFVEVKTRSSREYGDALESITYRKKQSLVRAAEIFLQERSLSHCDVAFWAAAVYTDTQEKIEKVEIIPDIFV
ncbi:MAG: YraN family protein [Bacillota bacterium]|nr:YraN family protein [Bacillota bacterium]